MTIVSINQSKEHAQSCLLSLSFWGKAVHLEICMHIAMHVGKTSVCIMACMVGQGF